MLKKTVQSINYTIQIALINLIKVYRMIISPHFGRCCRFHPSCSRYAIDALARFGVLKGLYLIMRRILRCHPLHQGGLDPVPQRRKSA